MTRDPTERFSDRVADYVRFRPGYPRQELIDYLRERDYLQASRVVADIGAGTGISSALLLDADCEVYAVEPNAAMREAAERALAERPRFHSVAGRAEATTLGDASMDLIAAGTAFHWFEPSATRAEFARILRHDGRVALFWNVRRHDTAFMRAYEAVLIEHCPGYAETNAARRDDEASIKLLFTDRCIDSATFANAQRFGFDGLLGRVLSSSWAPKPGNPAYGPMLIALNALFDAHAAGGEVVLDYDTRLHVGRVN